MSRQVVRGEYTNYIEWKVPAGIDLEDESTYQYGDRWGILYITNKKTGQEWKIEAYRESKSDEKRAEHLHISDGEDDDSDDEEEEVECFACGDKYPKSEMNRVEGEGGLLCNDCDPTQHISCWYCGERLDEVPPSKLSFVEIEDDLRTLCGECGEEFKKK